jgi:3',5'-cyclic AMP phosphodiesterase CpdA
MKNIIPKLFKLIILVSIIILPSSCRKKEKAAEFSFAFISDVHLQPENNAVKGFLEAIDTINDLKPDFVIVGGDNIIDALSQSHGKADSLYTLFLETEKALNMPVYHTMGNHEIYGIYSRSGADPNNPDYGEKMFENRIGKSYYSFDNKGWKFMILNSVENAGNDSYIGLIDEKQVAWIKEEIRKTDQTTPIVLSTHIPFITVETQKYKGTTLPNDSSLVIINGKEVIDLFKGHNLKLVLQGHLHIYEDIYIDGIRFITGGAIAAGWWSGPYLGHEEGFMLVKVKGDDLTTEFVDYNWIVKP